ncbi:Siroheme synthase [Bacteroidales bacterium Barb4]|nr:Siroheme synthase [Bacteroidales bacterium Barb4]
MFLPVSINITDKKIVLVGGGKTAFHKATVLHRFTDNAVVIAPEFHTGFDSLPFELKRKAYEPDDLNSAFLVYVCTDNEALNAAVKTECERRRILTSVCDNPSLCDFISPAIYKDGNLSIAVSSNAQNVRQSIRVRDRIKELLTKGVIEP